MEIGQVVVHVDAAKTEKQTFQDLLISYQNVNVKVLLDTRTNIKKSKIK